MDQKALEEIQSQSHEARDESKHFRARIRQLEEDNAGLKREVVELEGSNAKLQKEFNTLAQLAKQFQDQAQNSHSDDQVCM